MKIRTANGKGISITAESDVNLSGATLIAEGDNGALKKITAGNGGSGDINATDTVFIYGKEAVLEADGGTLSVNDNGGGKANGGTFIEDTDGNAGTIKLSKGDSDGTPERGNID